MRTEGKRRPQAALGIADVRQDAVPHRSVHEQTVAEQQNRSGDPGVDVLDLTAGQLDGANGMRCFRHFVLR